MVTANALTVELTLHSLGREVSVVEKGGHYWLDPQGTLWDISYYNQLASHHGIARKLAMQCGVPIAPTGVDALAGSAWLESEGWIRLQAGYNTGKQVELALELRKRPTEDQWDTLRFQHEFTGEHRVFYEIHDGVIDHYGVVDHLSKLRRITEEHL